MRTRIHPRLAVAALSAFLSAGAVVAQPSQDIPTDPRPQAPGQNLPSDTGVQATLPSGAVTGAGQPQGTLPQADDGVPEGLEQRARSKARAKRDAAANGDDVARRQRPGRSGG